MDGVDELRLTDVIATAVSLEAWKIAILDPGGIEVVRAAAASGACAPAGDCPGVAIWHTILCDSWSHKGGGCGRGGWCIAFLRC